MSKTPGHLPSEHPNQTPQAVSEHHSQQGLPKAAEEIDELHKQLKCGLVIDLPEPGIPAPQHLNNAQIRTSLEHQWEKIDLSANKLGDFEHDKFKRVLVPAHSQPTSKPIWICMQAIPASLHVKNGRVNFWLYSFIEVALQTGSENSVDIKGTHRCYAVCEKKKTVRKRVELPSFSKSDGQDWKEVVDPLFKPRLPPDLLDSLFRDAKYRSKIEEMCRESCDYLKKVPAHEIHQQLCDHLAKTFAQLRVRN